VGVLTTSFFVHLSTFSLSITVLRSEGKTWFNVFEWLLFMTLLAKAFQEPGDLKG